MPLLSAKPYATSIDLEAPALLAATGSLLAVTIIISRLAADHAAPMLWFLTIVLGGAGLLLFLLAAYSGAVRGAWRPLALYGLGAGAFQALPSAMAYLSVAHVGAGYVSLAFAFPLLITYALALMFGMERFVGLRALGVAVALAGGLLLAFGKFDGLDGASGVGWVLVASGIPFIVAGGNLFRTRFWPSGAQPILLAALMLLLAAALTAPFAVGLEGGTAWNRLAATPMLMLLTGLNIAAFALQFIAYFRLQYVAGPVYLSQIGSVAAAVGTPVAVLLLGETLPDGFALALTLIVAGAVLFQVAGRKAGPRSS